MQTGAAAASGDRTAFAAIYDRYANRLHDSASACCATAMPQRTASKTVLTAAAKLTQLRDADKLRPWLYSIARNEALRHQESAARGTTEHASRTSNDRSRTRNPGRTK